MVQQDLMLPRWMWETASILTTRGQNYSSPSPNSPLYNLHFHLFLSNLFQGRKTHYIHRWFSTVHSRSWMCLIHCGGVSGHSGTAVLQLGHSCSYKQQYASEKLQAEGEPRQTQRPAKGGVDKGQTLGPHQTFCLCEGFIRVDDVKADATQGQKTWRVRIRIMWKTINCSKLTPNPRP